MTSKTYHFGLLGYDIPYTLSPEIFSRIFERCEQTGDFTVYDIAPNTIASEIRRLGDLDGFSVTIPYKERVLPMVDELTEEARIIGAVNSVRVREGKLRGHNTDAAGFIHPLRHDPRPQPGQVLILGHGGSARAVLLALIREYPQAAFTICGRDHDHARSFVDTICRGFAVGRELRPMVFEDILDDDQFHLIVNCTPMGGVTSPDRSPLGPSFRFEHCDICYDLVYQPEMTRFLQGASDHGCRVINGLPMLVVQAVLSYRFWTGHKVDLNDVSEYILGVLGGETSP